MLSITAAPGAKKSSKDGIVDALPYIDSEYEEPGMKEMVTSKDRLQGTRLRDCHMYFHYFR